MVAFSEPLQDAVNIGLVYIYKDTATFMSPENREALGMDEWNSLFAAVNVLAEELRQLGYKVKA